MVPKRQADVWKTVQLSAVNNVINKTNIIVKLLTFTTRASEN